MDAITDIGRGPARPTATPVKWLIVALGVVGVGLLVVRHWLHIPQMLPYLLLLACPLLHFMHHGHGDHDESSGSVHPGSHRGGRLGKEEIV